MDRLHQQPSSSKSQCEATTLKRNTAVGQHEDVKAALTPSAVLLASASQVHSSGGNNPIDLSITSTMTRSPQDPSAGRKSMQTGPSESQSTAWTPAAPAYSSPTAGRPATLSPDTARVADTHARTSRFLRKSRSKQQLRSTAESNGTKHDEGKHSSACIYMCFSPRYADQSMIVHQACRLAAAAAA